ncbi:NADPH-dependent FMN reductase [Hymenobacter elongatus]|uniref:NAD(P)H-dependent oxidoreductase n=1 Tax=Hymenobacter elongatus TaxID=877208 RepID=A0A4Z0PHZ5_9BACT|nr:NADPH-dependent FMN reductase [Hymenobacter elongatus]TGE14450.1 NAD(P)H-dependent oxidoreductase [Hymenobacter elongatus]
MLFLAISGSLRSASTNSVVVRSLAALTPGGAQTTVYEGLNDLPHFNPDLDGPQVAEAVLAFRAALQQCSAVLISSPEYAHGVPGVLKNALDWVVSSGELAGKPVALFNTSPRATHAQASLIEILTTMGAEVLPAASPTLPIAGRGLTETAIGSDAALAEPLRAALALVYQRTQATAAATS